MGLVTAPTHEPLVTRALFDAAAPVGRLRQRHRSGSGHNSHPDTRRSYLLRSPDLRPVRTPHVRAHPPRQARRLRLPILGTFLTGRDLGADRTQLLGTGQPDTPQPDDADTEWRISLQQRFTAVTAHDLADRITAATGGTPATRVHAVRTPGTSPSGPRMTVIGPVVHVRPTRSRTRRRPG